MSISLSSIINTHPQFFDRIAKSWVLQNIAYIPIIGAIPSYLAEKALAQRINLTTAGDDRFNQVERLSLEIKWLQAGEFRNVYSSALCLTAIFFKIITPLPGVIIPILFLCISNHYLEKLHRNRQDILEQQWAISHLTGQVRLVTGMVGEINQLREQVAAQN